MADLSNHTVAYLSGIVISIQINAGTYIVEEHYIHAIEIGMEHWGYIFGQVVADTSDGMEKSFSTILDHTFLYILEYTKALYICEDESFSCEPSCL